MYTHIVYKLKLFIIKYNKSKNRTVEVFLMFLCFLTKFIWFEFYVSLSSNVQRGDDVTFSEEQLTRMTFDLYAAGTDTTSNTLLTGFLYLMNYPHIQGTLWHGKALTSLNENVF